MEEHMNYEPKTRINSTTLSQHNGRPVILVGVVKQIDSSKRSIKVEATDGQVVLVTLPSPLEEDYFEKLVEFHGTARGNQVIADNYLCLSDGSDFDAESYNELVKVIHCHSDNPLYFG